MAHSKLNKYTVGDYIIGIVMVLICFLALYPVWYTIIISFNDSNDALRGGIYWLPRKFSLESYKTVFQDKTIIKLSLWSRNVLTISYDSHTSRTCVQTSCDNLPILSFVSSKYL